MESQYDGASTRTSRTSRTSRTGMSRQSSFMLPKNEKLICVPDDDSINIEFVYYTQMIKKFAPNLSTEKDKDKVVPWVRKLYAAEYATEFFKIKRNRYLFKMVLSIMNDEMYGVFKFIPPAGPLKSPESFAVPAMPPAIWETDNMWDEMLRGEDNSASACTMHAQCPGGAEDGDDEDEEEVDTTEMSEEEKVRVTEELVAKRERLRIDRNKKGLYGALLDWEFQYLLHVSRPYAALMDTVQEKTRVAKWLQKLGSVRGDAACAKMKGVRNDYMMALLGYLYDLRLTGPFEHPPPDGPLESLETAMERLREDYPLTVPTQDDVNEFLSDQPSPAEGGAFCYVAVSGDLQATNLIQSQPVVTKDCHKMDTKSKC